MNRRRYWPGGGRLVGFLGLIAGLMVSGCIRIAVPPPPAVPVPSGRAGAVPVSLVFTGVPDVHRSDFARALPAARTPLATLFGSRVSNRTGSPAELLSPPLQAVLARTAVGRRLASIRAELHFTELSLQWRPPQEFIKTPRARYTGRVEVRLQGMWRIAPGGAAFERGRSFRVVRSERVFPGDQEAVMARMMGAALRDLVEDLDAHPR